MPARLGWLSRIKSTSENVCKIGRRSERLRVICCASLSQSIIATLIFWCFLPRILSLFSSLGPTEFLKLLKHFGQMRVIRNARFQQKMLKFIPQLSKLRVQTWLQNELTKVGFFNNFEYLCDGSKQDFILGSSQLDGSFKVKQRSSHFSVWNLLQKTYVKSGDDLKD